MVVLLQVKNATNGVIFSEIAPHLYFMKGYLFMWQFWAPSFLGKLKKHEPTLSSLLKGNILH